ncbi:MAG: hypothetical protein KF729_04555 [Sandaracinaceae bacterium]|nr:hypothetical protein [Sandaracinaceae bacterium]
MQLRLQDAMPPAATRDELAELVRAEVHARRWTPRASVIARLSRTLAALEVPRLEPELLAVCRELERRGDLQRAEGGYLAATPVRAVALGAERWRIFTSAPSASLDAALPGAFERTGLSRVRRAGDEGMHEAIAVARGVCLRPEAWAGLDRAPRADRAWLDTLDRRLDADPSPAGSYEREGEPSWRAWAQHEGRFVWRRVEQGRLWRARLANARWLVAWTRGASPARAPFIRLDRDEGTRARFAVAVADGAPLACRWESDGERARLTVGAWLPRAEYRYASIFGEPVEGGAWTLEAEHRAEVARVLSTRLGLVGEG